MFTLNIWRLPSADQLFSGSHETDRKAMEFAYEELVRLSREQVIDCDPFRVEILDLEGYRVYWEDFGTLGEFGVSMRKEVS
jgi:hypothetical protein